MPIENLGSNPSAASPEEVKELGEAARLAFSDELLDGCAGGHSDQRLVNFAKVSPCIYTMTPDGHFLLGEPQKQVFCVAGLSGHGFKMAPTLGQMMADYAFGINVEERWGTTFCSPVRFETSTSR